MATKLSREQFMEYSRIADEAREFMKKHQFAQALVAIDQALRLYPDSSSAWYDRGDILDELGRYVEACEAYERSIQITPNFYPAKSNLERLMRRHNIKRRQ